MMMANSVRLSDPPITNAWALGFSRQNLLPLTVLVVMLVMITAYWLPHHANIKRQQQQIFHQHSAQLVEDLKHQLTQIEQLVRSGTAFVNATSDLQQRDWQTFTESLALEKNYSGIQAFGVVRVLNNKDVDPFTQWMLQQGARDFSIYPAGERPEYAIVSHIQPFTSFNRAVLGFDVFSDPRRRQASLRAASLAQSALTPAVSLVQDADGNSQPGLILLQPVFSSGVPLVSAEQKLAALQNFIFVSFRVQQLLSAAWPSDHVTGLAFRWFDLTQGPHAGFLYQSAEFGSSSLFQQQIKLDLYGQPFMLEVQAPASFVQTQLPQVKLFELFAALVFTLLVFITFSLLNLRRFQAILLQQQLTEQLQVQHQQLFANEHRQALVLKASQLAWFEFDLPTGDGFYSDSCWRLLGYQRPLSAATQQLLTDAMTATDAVSFQQDLQLLIATSIEDFAQHYQLINRQGQHLYCRFQLYLWRDKAGDAKSLFGIITDQTALQLQLQTLKQWQLIARFNLLQSLQFCTVTASEPATVEDSELNVAGQLQKLHQQQLVQFFSRIQIDELKLPFSALPELSQVVDLPSVVQSVWRLLLAHGRAQQGQLKLDASLFHRQFDGPLLPCRQYLSLLLDAGATFGVAETSFQLHRFSLPEAEVLSFRFDLNADYVARLAQWQQQCEREDWQSVFAQIALDPTQEDEFAVLVASLHFWAGLMQGQFIIELLGNSPFIAGEHRSRPPVCQLLLRRAQVSATTSG